MADFVAVIRRAVDGLANNTPEMRTKVYDKARSAVQRQLENMKPRPSDDMLRRQMEKLEAAIVEVEGEHAEALPPIEEPALAEEPVSYPAETEEALAEEPAAQEEPDTYEEQAEQETVAAEEPVAEEAEAHEPEPQAESEAYAESTPAYPEEEAEQVAAAPEEQEPSGEEPQRYGDWRDEIPEEDTIRASASPDEAPYETIPRLEDTSDRLAEEPAPSSEYSANGYHPAHEEEPVAAGQPQEPAWEHESAAAAQRPEEEWGWNEPAETRQAAEAESAWNDVPDLSLPTRKGEEADSHAAAAEPIDARFVQETNVAADSVRMPSVSDLPEFGAKSSAEDRQADGTRKEESDPWADLEELIGYNKDAPFTGTTRDPLAAESAKDDAPVAKTYRVTPEKKRSYTGVVLGLLGLVVVLGGGYGLWLNREALTEMVSAFVEPGPPGTETPSAETTPATPQTPPAQPSNGNGNGAAAPTPDDGSVAGSKFTQRLLPDGTEVDEGPGGAPAGGAEGQSVASLNSPPAPAASEPPAQGTTPAATGEQGAEAAGNQPAPTANPSDAPALAGEKMFLYEERLGQTAPTAIEGAVSWSLQREPGENGAQEPVVQGRIAVPGRGLTALITVKRNADPSLPASHLIEIVFSVPPDFEGGAIDSVQRIAMKQTEQDRGNALIAVPAKITDDFHMIALNDFPDARTTNLELLRSRDWMDIPVAYRNGRRALLTLQKGPAGVQAFNEAIREWAALGNSASSQ
ncbi:hypothetical protein [Rhizobium sp. LCM 4573]|uniref:hypothetical protein n=1 Tax=Rhizobium sp. LCM 4573 TaxID=1848291 RepID=UPI0008D93762|nr:hypothetical protein [Rhizobium sp. LCM 4573]OHV84533.1 hypothetical protein LCM4573_02355 [Rhizobium sp. LCM 4573]